MCELNDSDAIRDPLDWTTKQGFIYGGTKVCCIWLRLFLDYKWSSVCNFTKYTAVPRLSRLVNKSGCFESENAVRLTLRTSLGRRTKAFFVCTIY